MYKLTVRMRHLNARPRSARRYTMKPGTNFEPAYKLMAEYKIHEDECERLNMTYDAEYWRIKLSVVQNTLKALTGEWPGALHHDDGIMIVHGTYEQTFNL